MDPNKEQLMNWIKAEGNHIALNDRLWTNQVSVSAKGLFYQILLQDHSTLHPSSSLCLPNINVKDPLNATTNTIHLIYAKTTKPTPSIWSLASIDLKEKKMSFYDHRVYKEAQQKMKGKDIYLKKNPMVRTATTSIHEALIESNHPLYQVQGLTYGTDDCDMKQYFIGVNTEYNDLPPCPSYFRDHSLLYVLLLVHLIDSGVVLSNLKTEEDTTSIISKTFDLQQPGEDFISSLVSYYQTKFTTLVETWNNGEVVQEDSVASTTDLDTPSVSIPSTPVISSNPSTPCTPSTIPTSLSSVSLCHDNESQQHQLEPEENNIVVASEQTEEHVEQPLEILVVAVSPETNVAMVEDDVSHENSEMETTVPDEKEEEEVEHHSDPEEEDNGEAPPLIPATTVAGRHHQKMHLKKLKRADKKRKREEEEKTNEPEEEKTTTIVSSPIVPKVDMKLILQMKQAQNVEDEKMDESKEEEEKKEEVAPQPHRKFARKAPRNHDINNEVTRIDWWLEKAAESHVDEDDFDPLKSSKLAHYIARTILYLSGLVAYVNARLVYDRVWKPYERYLGNRLPDGDVDHYKNGQDLQNFYWKLYRMDTARVNLGKDQQKKMEKIANLFTHMGSRVFPLFSKSLLNCLNNSDDYCLSTDSLKELSQMLDLQSLNAMMSVKNTRTKKDQDSDDFYQKLSGCFGMVTSREFQPYLKTPGAKIRTIAIPVFMMFYLYQQSWNSSKWFINRDYKTPLEELGMFSIENPSSGSKLGPIPSAPIGNDNKKNTPKGNKKQQQIQPLSSFSEDKFATAMLLDKFSNDNWLDEVSAYDPKDKYPLGFLNKLHCFIWEGIDDTVLTSQPRTPHQIIEKDRAQKFVELAHIINKRFGDSKSKVDWVHQLMSQSLNASWFYSFLAKNQKIMDPVKEYENNILIVANRLRQETQTKMNRLRLKMNHEGQKSGLVTKKMEQLEQDFVETITTYVKELEQSKKQDKDHHSLTFPSSYSITSRGNDERGIIGIHDYGYLIAEQIQLHSEQNDRTLSQILYEDDFLIGNSQDEGYDLSVIITETMHALIRKVFLCRESLVQHVQDLKTTSGDDNDEEEGEPEEEDEQEEEKEEEVVKPNNKRRKIDQSTNDEEEEEEKDDGEEEESDEEEYDGKDD